MATARRCSSFDGRPSADASAASSSRGSWIVTPAPSVPDVMAECAAKGVQGAIVISAGVREIGPEGEELERRILAQVREARIRVIGPNCLGVMNPAGGMNATFAAVPVTQGKAGFMTQSGALGIAFLGGLLIERAIIRPVENAPVLSIVIVCVGLLIILNSIAGWIYTFVIKPFPSPFPPQPVQIGGIVFGSHSLGAIGVTLVMLLFLYLFFRYTTLGLTMRAAAQNPVSSRLVGIRVSWMLALGWGLAALVGAVAGHHPRGPRGGPAGRPGPPAAARVRPAVRPDRDGAGARRRRGHRQAEGRREPRPERRRGGLARGHGRHRPTNGEAAHAALAGTRPTTLIRVQS